MSAFPTFEHLQTLEKRSLDIKGVRGRRYTMPASGTSMYLDWEPADAVPV
ncbi:hypothetical protein COLSTE_01474 [Collinsella stercoris DSM 13279]|uniref:Uncharacterized protein n=1 Tax=Collinsella stercoris DSM 13279 TaxID=445975 RepID=B6GBL4_9ACTN|nr:hypothetical protein COLSTE_01474 [Collinsella stercoris DSM 13279]